MALVDRYIRLRFTQGVDTEPDEKGLPPGKFTRLENATFEKAISHEKRPGHEALTREFGVTFIVLSGALDVWSDGDTLYRHTGRSYVLSYGEGTDWKVVGLDMRSPTVDTQKFVKGAVERWNGDMAVAASASVTLAAWEQPDGIHMMALDADDGTPIYGPELVSTGSRPRVALCGTQLHLYHHDGNQISCVRINPHDLFLSWKNWESTTLTSDLDTRSSLAYDVVPYNGGVVLAYPSSAGDIKVANISPIASIATTGSAFSRPDPVTCSLGYMDAGPAVAVSPQGYLHVYAWASGSGVLRSALDASTFVRLNTASLDSAVTTANGDTCVRLSAECETERRTVSGSDSVGVCFYELTSSAGSRIKVAGIDTVHSASIDAAHVSHRARLVGRPYALDADVYCPVMSTEPTQQTTFLVNTDGRPVAKMMPGLASPLTSGTVPSWTRMPDGRDVIVLGRRDQVPTFLNQVGDITGSNFADRGLALASVHWRATASVDWATKDGYVFVGGGQLHQLDGASATEVGFHINPEGTTVTPVGGTSKTAGTYLYSPVYEWTDRYGNRQLSGGEIVTCTLTASGDVNLMIPTPQFTLKGDTAVFSTSGPVRVALWRTKVGGTTFFRADAPTRPIVVDRSSSYHHYRDTTSDATLATREVDPRTVFTENAAPPACRHVAVVKGRVMVAGIEGRPNDVWYSKLGTEGDGPLFTDSNVIAVPAEGGPITGLGQIDDKGIVLKLDRAMAFVGDGPTDLETDGALFSEPQTVEIDAGCVDSRSIVNVQGEQAQGLMFKSLKGIKLLDRGMGVHDIGAPVSDHDGLRIASAVREPGTDRVRFQTADGLTLMYDSRWGQWSTYTNCEGAGAAVWRDRYALLRHDGTVMVSSTGSRDGTETYPMLLETGWIGLSGLQGYGRVRSLHILGDYHSAHTLRVDVAYDYRGYSETHEIPSSRIVRVAGYGSGSYGSGSYGGNSDPVYQVKVNFKRQRCQAVRLRIRDVPGSSGGKSFSISEVALTVAVEKGQARLPSRKRSG